RECVKFMETYFPSIHSLIVRSKLISHRELAIKLQKLESHIFIDIIVPRLINELDENDFISTIHDSIVTNQSAVEKVVLIIKEEFLKIGLSPTIKINEIKKLKHKPEDSPRKVPPAQTLIVE